MVFDFVVLALMGLGVGAGLFDWIDTRQSQTSEDETAPDEELPIDDPVDDTGGAPSDDVGDPATSTIVLIEDAEGNVTETSVDTAGSEGAVTLTGTAEPDIITADPDAGLEFGIASGDGDDVISFGVGVSADGGEGSDSLELTVTGTAFTANGAAGAEALSTRADLSDTTDALAIEIADGVEGFVHFVTVTTTGADTLSEDGGSVSRLVSQDLYVLVTDSAGPPAEEQVLGPDDGTQIVRIDLGAQLETYALADQGSPTSVQGAINTDPLIAINRDITTETALAL